MKEKNSFPVGVNNVQLKLFLRLEILLTVLLTQTEIKGLIGVSI